MKSSQASYLNKSEPQAAQRSSRQEPPTPVEQPELDRQVQTAADLGHHLDALPIGAPDDGYEKEADQTAAQVVGRLESGSGPSASVQATPTPGPAVQAKAEGGGSGSAAGAALTQLPSAPGSGRSLEPAVRSPMERAFGADLSSVRLHTGRPAQQLNQSLEARATTVGRDIYFDQGEYDPDSASGRELLAHELTHVLQQRRGGHRLQRGMQGPKRERKGKEKAPGVRRRPGPPPIPSDPGDSPERQARIDAGPPTISPPPSPTPAPVYSNFSSAAAQAAGQGAVPVSVASPSQYESVNSPIGAGPATTPANEYGQLQLAPPPNQPPGQYDSVNSPINNGSGAAQANEYGQLQLAPAESDYETVSSVLGRDNDDENR